ncbi:MAG: hypothetical protein GXW90_10610 [Tepidanaerobacter acetatoxydans]|uniref:hypothetical protein n=1 Tax=Tepidanaerobacter acetatoxydans TaxID=499229 RepID=UPI0026EDB0AD|nr:hypothetical protein [Tepidanaerobacter acetatoxydans]NLU11361.1 hypothetical protein [Tepidanaerobacter acetatoxydans]
MKTIQDLDLLVEKYKRNSKLGLNDSEAAMEGIQFLLRGDTQFRGRGMEYVFEFPNDIGVNAFFNYYRVLDEEEKNKAIQELMTCKEFGVNLSNKSVNRATALIGLMLKENPEDGNINHILKSATQLILGKNKKEISNQCAEYFRRNVIDTAGDKLFDMKIDKIVFTDEDFYLLKSWVIASVFTSEELYKPAVQLKVLQWLTGQDYKVHFSQEDKNAILPYYEKWDNEIKAILNDSPLAEMFEDIPLPDDMNKESGKPEEGKYKKVSVIHPAKAVLANLDTEITKLIEENNTLRLDLNKKNDTIGQLELKKNELLDEINELNRNLNQKLIEINDKDKEIDSLKRQGEDLENRLKAALKLNTREENESLNNLKFKLSSQLKHDYSDFCKIAEKPMTKELGDVLLAIMENTFYTLIKNGIKLE